MRAYPSVNWWPGNLRSYESKACFAARFRDLNGISSRRCLEFLDLGPREGAPADAGDIERLSSILCEPAQDVESILQPSIRFVRCGRYAPPPNTRGRQFIRYCEACANLGYHSYLHEAEWLARCPFHLCELKEALIKAYTGSIMGRHLDALGVLMRKHCQSWPRCDSSLESSSGEHLTALGDWVVFATQAAACLSSAEVWCSAPEGEFGTLSLGQAFGQLRAITPMPEAIETLLTEAGGKWRMRSRLFAAEAKLELERLNALGLRFPRVLEVYRGISAFAANPPSFVTRLNAVKDSLRARHGNCHCEWGLFRGGWELHWIKVYPDEQPYLSTPCPFEFALAELDGGWGGLGQALTGRRAVQEQVRLMYLVREMYAAGLVQYTANAEVSAEGYLHIGQDLPSCCLWVDDSPLTELLDTASTWEIESAHSAISTWLDNIERGAQPGHREDPKYCVRLGQTADGLRLVRWIGVLTD